MGREVWIYQLDYPILKQAIERKRDYWSALEKSRNSNLSILRENANSTVIKTSRELWYLLEDVSLLQHDQDQLNFTDWGIHLLFESPTKSAANSFMYQFYTFTDEMVKCHNTPRDHYGSVLKVDIFRQFLDYLIILCQKASTLPLKRLPVEFTPPTEKINGIILHYDTQHPIMQLIEGQLENIQRMYNLDPKPVSLPPELDLVIRKDFVIDHCLRMHEMVSETQSNIFILDSV